MALKSLTEDPSEREDLQYSLMVQEIANGNLKYRGCALQSSSSSGFCINIHGLAKLGT